MINSCVREKEILLIQSMKRKRKYNAIMKQQNNRLANEIISIKVLELFCEKERNLITVATKFNIKYRNNNKIENELEWVIVPNESDLN